MQNPTWLQSSRLNSASSWASSTLVMILMPALHYWRERDEKGDQSAGLLLEWSHRLTYKPSNAERGFAEGWSKEAQNVTRLSRGYCLLDGPLVFHRDNGIGKGERAGEGGTATRTSSCRSENHNRRRVWELHSRDASENITVQLLWIHMQGYRTNTSTNKHATQDT